jgi:hypothetical protein
VFLYDRARMRRVRFGSSNLKLLARKLFEMGRSRGFVWHGQPCFRLRKLSTPLMCDQRRLAFPDLVARGKTAPNISIAT